MCSGPRRGNQFTYALLDERVARTRREARRSAGRTDAALLHKSWSCDGEGLRLVVWHDSREVKTGMAMVEGDLERSAKDGLIYWALRDDEAVERSPATTHLLPTYDEYLIAYKDRDEVLARRRR